MPASIFNINANAIPVCYIELKETLPLLQGPIQKYCRAVVTLLQLILIFNMSCNKLKNDEP